MSTLQPGVVAPGAHPHRRPVGAVVAVVVASVLTVAGCSSDGSKPAVTGTVSSQPVTCAWPTRADRATLNVAYPDTGATYWTTRYRLAPGERVEIAGSYPAARYFSFVTYHPSGGVRGSVPDRDIEPSRGTNPFAGEGEGEDGDGDSGGTRPTGRYVVRITPKVDREQPPANTIPGGATGTVIYRVYLPDDARDAKGGVALPTLRVVGTGGASRTLAPCATSGSNPEAVRIVDENGPATDRPAPPQPVFIRPEAGAARLFPNPDNVYLATIVKYTPGQLVVVRGSAPSFPDTAVGDPITGEEQVRYWSVCTNEYRKPYPVTDCVADEHVPVDAQGRYTIVVSTPAERPANATKEQGVAWLDWGSTTVDGLLLVRNMLPAPGFTQSALDVPAGALASATMGPYAPVGRYCPVADFARGGAAACEAG